MGNQTIYLAAGCFWGVEAYMKKLAGVLDTEVGYMGGVARQNGMESLLIGGTENHAHLLLLAPPTIAPAKAVQLIKGGSSKWVHEAMPEENSFSWQSGYGVFSVGFSQIEATKRYIQSQENHHRVVTFEEEYRRFLERHGIQYDKRFYLG